ncbi:hypothetical protein LEP1GSC120_0221 [Leptospira santarosai str. 200702252]|nr:hypothetical protein LEP1GSC130_3369 [Leptospira santarosai str. 200403458]EMO96931.1 hypothetical protein LEP1GSC120_0221 [Leptospira santarosai str. 200702252]
MQPLQEICCIWEPMPNSKGERYGSLKSGMERFLLYDRYGRG